MTVVRGCGCGCGCSCSENSLGFVAVPQVAFPFCLLLLHFRCLMLLSERTEPSRRSPERRYLNFTLRDVRSEILGVCGSHSTPESSSESFSRLTGSVMLDGRIAHCSPCWTIFSTSDEIISMWTGLHCKRAFNCLLARIESELVKRLAGSEVADESMEESLATGSEATSQYDSFQYDLPGSSRCWSNCCAILDNSSMESLGGEGEEEGEISPLLSTKPLDDCLEGASKEKARNIMIA